MKKQLMYLMAVCVAVFTYIASPSMAQTSSEEEPSREAIVLTQNKTVDPTIPRSLINIENVSAILDTIIGQIEISLDDVDGNVHIYISQSGVCVSSYQCNATFEPNVILPTPIVDGNYCLTIITNNTEYIGYFSL